MWAIEPHASKQASMNVNHFICPGNSIVDDARTSCTHILDVVNEVASRKMAHRKMLVCVEGSCDNDLDAASCYSKGSQVLDSSLAQTHKLKPFAWIISACFHPAQSSSESPASPTELEPHYDGSTNVDKAIVSIPRADDDHGAETMTGNIFDIYCSTLSYSYKLCGNRYW